MGYPDILPFALVRCGGLSKNAPPSPWAHEFECLLTRDWNSERIGVGGVALLEEGCHRGWALRFQKPKPEPQLVDQGMALSFCSSNCLYVTMSPSMMKRLNLWNCKQLNAFFVRAAWATVSLHRSTIVTSGFSRYHWIDPVLVILEFCGQGFEWSLSSQLVYPQKPQHFRTSALWVL